MVRRITKSPEMAELILRCRLICPVHVTLGSASHSPADSNASLNLGAGLGKLIPAEFGGAPPRWRLRVTGPTAPRSIARSRLRRTENAPSLRSPQSGVGATLCHPTPKGWRWESRGRSMGKRGVHFH
ncbi:hypothetical protein SBV1_630011 [Verrucomicrobia bacterium]|nr:hypothetical protein SBV1_630011 [Verrucomicrobiota bacterium]